MATNVIQNSEVFTKNLASPAIGKAAVANPARAPQPVMSVPKMLDEVTEDRIRQRAYEIYMARRGENGDDHSDWIQAERELREEAARRGAGAKDRINGAGLSPVSGITGRSSPRMFSGG